MNPALLARLAALVGDGALFTDSESRSRTAGNWSPRQRTARRATCDIVVRPADVDAVCAVVAAVADAGGTILPFGGGTGVVEPRRATVALDLTDLDDLRWDETNLTVTAGAGARLAGVDETLGAHGYTIGAWLGSANLATVGGAVATNAVGLLSGRYGRTSDRVVALDVVLADGRVHSLGPEESRAFVGAQGQLGVIVSATLAMHPSPEVRAWAAYDFDNFDAAVDALRLIVRSDARPSVARLIERNRVVLGFEGDEIVQAGHYQLACAVCVKVGGTTVANFDGDAWLNFRVRPGAWADRVAVGASWSDLPGVCAALTADGATVEVGHPTPNGAAVEATGEGDLLALAETAGAWGWHHFGGPPSSAVALLRAALDPTGVFSAS